MERLPRKQVQQQAASQRVTRTRRKKKKPKGDLHSSQATDEPAKKTTPVVRFGKPANSMEAAADDSSDESAMMVQVVDHNHTTPLLNSTTIINVPAQDGARYGTTILIDNGYTEYMIMSYPVAMSLGYELRAAQGRSYNTTNGVMTTNLQVSINDIRLPHLSRSRTFSAAILVAPEQSGDFGYGMIMGCRQMDLLGIDTSRTEKVITWGPDITVPMTPSGYCWTERRIQSLLSHTSETTLAEPAGANNHLTMMSSPPSLTMTPCQSPLLIPRQSTRNSTSPKSLSATEST